MEEELMNKLILIGREIKLKEQFIEGHRNGYNIAKGEILELLAKLPPIKDNDEESLNDFLGKLNDVIITICKLTPKK